MNSQRPASSTMRHPRHSARGQSRQRRKSSHHTLALLTLAFVAANAARSPAQDEQASCVKGTVLFRSCGASSNWCGFTEYTTPPSPTIKYLTQTATEQAFPDSTGFSGDIVGTYGLARAPACAGTASFIATATWGDYPGGYGSMVAQVSYGGTIVACGSQGFNSTNAGSVTLTASCALTVGGAPAVVCTGQRATVSGSITFTPDQDTGIRVNVWDLGACTNSVSGSFPVPDSYYGDPYQWTVDFPTREHVDTTPAYTPATRTLDLTVPTYRTNVSQSILSALASCPTGAFTEIPAFAQSSMSPTNIQQVNLISITKVGYKITFMGEARRSYTVTWRVVTNYADLSAPMAGTITEHVLGQGEDVEASTSEHFLVPPLDRDASLSVDVESVTITPDDGGGCCGSDSAPGNGTLAVGSIHARFYLGKGLYGDSGAQLFLIQDALTNQSYTPATLQFAGNPDSFELITNSQGIRQVLGQQALAYVVTNDAYSCEVRFYSLANVGAKGGDGLYTVANSPYVTWTIRNPDGANAATNLQVIETRPSRSITNQYNWSDASQTWTLICGNSLRMETKQVAWDAPSQIQTETRKTYTGTNQLVAQEVKKFKVFPFGWRLIEQHLGAPGAEISTTNAWFTTGGNAGLLDTVTRSDGSWEKYINYDNARPTQIIHAPPTNQAPTSDSGFARFTSLDYDASHLSGTGDDDSISTNEPRIAIEYLYGIANEVARSYLILRPGQRLQIQAPTLQWWGSSDNLCTTNSYYTNGPFGGYLKSIFHPNGTATVYLYETNATQKTTTVLEGQPDPASDTNILNGTKTVAVVGLAGQTLSRTVYATPQTSIALSQETYGDFDELFRPGRVTFLDGTFTLTTYDCCGVSVLTNRDGTRTDLTYDDLKRLSTEARNGITLIYTYDGAGRRLTTVRQGTNGNSIYLERNGYDLAGRTIAQTNALGFVTTFSESTSGNLLTRTTTNPDLTTEIKTFAADGSPLQVSGTAVAPMRYVYGLVSDGVTKASALEIRLDAYGGTNEWVQTLTDPVGRVSKRIFPAAQAPYPFELNTYNGLGLLTNHTDADGDITLYGYSPTAEPAYTVADMNGDGHIDFAGGDRITFTTNDVVADNGTNVRRTRTYVWPAPNVDASTLISTFEASTDGLQTWSTIWNNSAAVTTHSQTVFDPSHGYRIVTVTAPDGSYTATTNQYGRAISVTQRAADGAQVGGTVYGYDAHGRQNTVTDARTGTLTRYFDAADNITNVTTQAPAPGQAGQSTTYFFNNMNRLWKTLLPDGGVVTNGFNSAGDATMTAGARTYPVQNGFDAQHRNKSLTTWQNSAGGSGAATTTWKLDPYRGWPTNKTYDGNAPGPSYGYTPAGRLNLRTWAHGTTTTNIYTKAGDLAAIGYSDATPSVTNALDRRGRQIGVTNGSAVTVLTLNDAGQTLLETNATGLLAGLSLASGYDQFLRRTNVTFLNQQSTLSTINYRFDSASRLATISQPSTQNAINYSYLANSPLLDHISYTNNGVLRMTRNNKYDNLNRLTNLTWTVGSSNVASFAYQYNTANQRTRVALVDGSYWLYGYDALGQVTSAKKYWSDGTPVAGQQSEYAFDDIGNRKSTKTGGDQWGANLRRATYSANNLNQYTSRDVPGYINVIGTANAAATVTLWADGGLYAATSRHGQYYRGELYTNNSASPLWLSITNVAILQNPGTSDIETNIVGNAFLPQTPEALLSDPDGNLTNDGAWSYTWDAENRLISMQSSAGVPPAARKKLDFAYDSQGRRLQKIVSTNNGSIYLPQSTNRFVYDGWNLIGILDGGDNLLYSFAWGTDLSGTFQGAGGVAGLTSMTVYSGPNAGTYFYCFDGNGNVVALVSAADGTVAARYEYGPFGELVRATGPMALLNPVRFSTKCQDDETGFLFYGYRYYGASPGRWLGRDPIEERGGLNLYGFVGNQPINKTDRDGRAAFHQAFPQRASFDVSIDTHHYYSDVIIGFRSGWKAQGCPDCKDIRLAQVYKDIYEDLFDHIVRSEDWKLDADKASDPWYPNQTSQYAYVVMHDAPGIRWYYPNPGYQVYGVTQIFETCAYCADKGRRGFIGCVTWGHSVAGFRSSSSWGGGSNIVPLPPSDTFLRAFDPELFTPDALN